MITGTPLRPGPQPRDTEEWKKARRAAFVQDALTTFTHAPSAPMSFYDVSHKLHLSTVRYLELQDVDVDQIVGSVGRYNDFTRAFFPRKDHLKRRWQGVERMLASSKEWPPVELFKVGEVYFVRDGNHRVSVARQYGIASLSALVWEYETDVPLEPDSDVDAVLCDIAHSAFVEQTEIDRLCPELKIEITQPGGYQDLLLEMEAFGQAISKIDGRDVAFDEAVTLWAEIRYLPIVEIIRQRYVLQQFPGRTEADLYLWLCRNRDELQENYGHHVLMEEAADDLASHHGETALPMRRIRQALGWVSRAVASWTEGTGQKE